MAQITGIILALILILFPIWVAIHAWRKDYKTWATLIGVSYFVPFLPQVLALIAIFTVRPHQPNWGYIPNPKVYAGCGTKFYGAADKREDGSFVTTQWFCLLYLPLIPIQSYRVVRGDSSTQFMGASITSTTEFVVVESLKIHTKQVIQPYILMAAFIVLAVAIGKGTKGVPDQARMATNAILGLLVVSVIIGYRLLRVK